MSNEEFNTYKYGFFCNCFYMNGDLIMDKLSGSEASHKWRLWRYY